MICAQLRRCGASPRRGSWTRRACPRRRRRRARRGPDGMCHPASLRLCRYAPERWRRRRGAMVDVPAPRRRAWRGARPIGEVPGLAFTTPARGLGRAGARSRGRFCGPAPRGARPRTRRVAMVALRLRVSAPLLLRGAPDSPDMRAVRATRPTTPSARAACCGPGVSCPKVLLSSGDGVQRAPTPPGTRPRYTRAISPTGTTPGTRRAPRPRRPIAPRPPCPGGGLASAPPSTRRGLVYPGRGPARRAIISPDQRGNDGAETARAAPTPPPHRAPTPRPGGGAWRPPHAVDAARSCHHPGRGPADTANRRLSY